MDDRGRLQLATGEESAVASETSTCPPWPAAQIRAALWTSMPTYPSVGDDGRARVEAHPYRDRAGARGRSCASAAAAASRHRIGKGDEEGIALGVDLDAALPLERGPEHAPVLRERAGIRLRPELVQKQRGAFDVGEKERHRAPRELGHRP